MPSPQLPQLLVSVSIDPGLQTASVSHAPHSPHAPHSQLSAWHARARVRDPSPHDPQLPSSESLSPAAQTPSELQAHSPTLGALPQVVVLNKTDLPSGFSREQVCQVPSYVKE